jgi:F0F1-type ATP synthase assembly protein I
MPFNRPIPDDQPRRKLSAGIQGLVQAETVMQMALLLPSAVFIGWLAGAWLDSLLHQKWIAIAGVIIGSISGLVGVIRMVMAAEKASRSGNIAQDGTEKGQSDNLP